MRIVCTLNFIGRTYIKQIRLIEFMNKLLDVIIEGAQDKKAKNIISLDLTGFDGSICDHFVICNAESTTQVSAIADGIEMITKKSLDERVWRIEGATNGLWVVMDYGNIMVHIFQTEMRDFYKLEELWAKAPISEYESEE